MFYIIEIGTDRERGQKDSNIVTDSLINCIMIHQSWFIKNKRLSHRPSIRHDATDWMWIGMTDGQFYPDPFYRPNGFRLPLDQIELPVSGRGLVRPTGRRSILSGSILSSNRHEATDWILPLSYPNLTLRFNFSNMLFKISTASLLEVTSR